MDYTDHPFIDSGEDKENRMDDSFPSGHAGSSFASAVVLYRKLPKKFGIPALATAILISFSRLYVGVHYPSDVLGGAVLGVICSFLGEWIAGCIEKKKQKIE